MITELMACSLADAFQRTFYTPSTRRQVGEGGEGGPGRGGEGEQPGGAGREGRGGGGAPSGSWGDWVRCQESARGKGHQCARVPCVYVRRAKGM